MLAKAPSGGLRQCAADDLHGRGRDVYEEGALIFPGVKVQSDYQMTMDIVRMCQMRIRVPEQWWGDYLATARRGPDRRARMLKLAMEIGWDTLGRYARDWLDYSEQRMIECYHRHARRDGFTRRARHDPFPGHPREGVPIKVTVEVDPKPR